MDKSTRRFLAGMIRSGEGRRIIEFEVVEGHPLSNVGIAAARWTNQFAFKRGDQKQ